VFALSTAPAPGLARLAAGSRAARKPDDGVQSDLSACNAQADAPDGEPVFWRDGRAQDDADDDFVQPDSPNDCPVSIVA
jgi:hypothetical protein